MYKDVITYELAEGVSEEHLVKVGKEVVTDWMAKLDGFIHSETMRVPIHVPHLVKIAMVHYQFETIHPFLDGNGRIGRLLITLYLLDKEILQKPTLYLSDFFERNRRDYYDNLTQVRNNNDMLNWLQFFLQGIIETADSSIDTFQKIISLRNDIELNKLITLGRKQADGKRLINELYKRTTRHLVNQQAMLFHK